MTENTPDSLKDKISGSGLYWLAKTLNKTCKFQVTHLERFEKALDSGRPLVFTSWHGMTMMTVPLIQSLIPNVSDFFVLMPDDWRGRALRIWTEKMGATPHPMNLTGDSTMGMARQVLRLTRGVVGGKSLLINPDGPDGPSQVVKPGITFIAKKANALIVPFGAYCRNGYTVPRWDRYTVPYPFSRISYHIGEIIDGLPEDDVAANKLITDTLNRVTLQAAADYYERAE
jgi:lysophospholipid acyltransferase (LPLAT)-like uncharacterized protein